MQGRPDRVSRLHQAIGQMMTALEILLRTQDREVQVRHFDRQHFVAGDKRSSFSAGGANQPTGACIDLSHGCNIRFNL